MKRHARIGTAFLAITAALAAIGLGTSASATTLIADGQVATTTPIQRTDPTADTMSWDGRDATFAQAMQNAIPALAPVPLSTVASKANIAAQPLCTSAEDLTGAQGFCWNATNGDESGSGWIPQGVTTSSGANATGLVDGRKLVITSWHNPDNSQVRITVVDDTNPGAVKYLHALLVIPSNDPAIGFKPMAGHGDAVVLYGDKLYVGNYVPSLNGVPAADRSGFDVFDLSEFWAVDTTATPVPVAGYYPGDGKFHADGFPYVLPRIGTFTYPAAGCDQNTTTQPCISGASLDTTGTTPAIVSVAGSANAPVFGADNGVILRWPLDASSGLLATDGSGTAHASDAFLDSVPGVQGVAMRHDQFILSGPCPEWVSGGSTSPYCLYQAWLGEPVTLTARVAYDGENVAYDSQTGQLWYINEHARVRLAIHVPWPTFQPPLQHTVGADFTGDGKADLLGVTISGVLDLYPGNGDGTFGNPVQIGTGWGSMVDLAAGDFTGDENTDLIALDNTGVLWLYPGAGTLNGENTLGTRVQIGTGWGGYKQLSAIDANSDGKPDLLTIDPTGTLWDYPGTGTLNGQHTLGARVQISTGWGAMQQLSTPGPLTAGGKPCLLAVDSAGAQWAYQATGTLSGTSTFAPPIQIGSNWTSMQPPAAADFNGDGIGDLAAIQNSDGGLYIYPGTGTINGLNTLGRRIAVTTDW